MSNLINTIKNNDSTTNTGLAVVTFVIIPFLAIVVLEVLNGANINM